MISHNELLKKCISGEPINCEDLGIHPNLKDCCMMIDCGDQAFYTDGLNYYDRDGNLLSDKLIKKYRR